MFKSNFYFIGTCSVAVRTVILEDNIFLIRCVDIPSCEATLPFSYSLSC